MIEARALASLSLSARNDLTLPGALSCDAVCSAPIMPPELLSLSIADCASDNQFGAVLDAIDGVDAIVDNSVLPLSLAAA